MGPDSVGSWIEWTTTRPNPYVSMNLPYLENLHFENDTRKWIILRNISEPSLIGKLFFSTSLLDYSEPRKYFTRATWNRLTAWPPFGFIYFQVATNCRRLTVPFHMSMACLTYISDVSHHIYLICSSCFLLKM